MGSLEKKTEAIQEAVNSVIVCTDLLYSVFVSDRYYVLSVVTGYCAFRHSVCMYEHRDVELITLRSLTVILSWYMGKPMTLFFDPLVTNVLFLSGKAPLRSL